MGKKKKDKFRDVDFLDGSNKDLNKALERFNVKGANSGRNYSTGSSNRRSIDDVKKELKNAARNDYDYRRSLEAAAMSGDKKAGKLSTKGNIGGILRGQDHLAKLKKEHVGGGGMGGSKNIMGLTQALVKHDRDTQTAGYDDKYATKEELSALEQQQEATPEEPEYEPSTEITDAKNRVDKWESGTFDLDVYGKSSDDQQDSASVSPASTAQAESHLEKFKNELKQRKNLKPTL